MTGRGQFPLVLQLPDLLAEQKDDSLDVYFATELFNSSTYRSIPDAEALIQTTLGHFQNLHNSDLECTFPILS
jgi:hypothetical protein